MKALEFVNVTKAFGDCISYQDISFSVERGEIHALLGENGAGKSTLMNTLFGLYTPTKGHLKIFENDVVLHSPLDAFKLKIGMVHQHFMLIHNMTVIQNILLGSEKMNIFGAIDYSSSRKKLKELSESYNLEIDLDQKIEDITVGMQQRVEILKILFKDAEILIFDEPTAVLTPKEIEEFEKILLKLKASGKTILLITHKLKEIKAVADRCTIIRKGRYIETVNVAVTKEAELATKMVGRTVDFHLEKTPIKTREPILKLGKIILKDKKGIKKLNNLNLEVFKGEIFGIAGVDGNGQRELSELLFGLKHKESGEIFFNGETLKDLTPALAHMKKISMIPEDRHKTGLVLDYSIAYNGILHDRANLPFSKKGKLQFKEIFSYAQKLIQRFDIRPSDQTRKASELSGGNQQKVILAREIEHNPELLIAVQPTRGLDVGAIEVIHRELLALKETGKSVLLISFELDEILALSDRVGVIYNGSINQIFEGSAINRNSIGLAMIGNQTAHQGSAQ